MLGRSTLASSSNMDSRIFIYEVEGLNQGSRFYQGQATIRSSGKMLISVPFARMNAFMQQIHAFGGRIVSIQPSDQLAGTGAGVAQAESEG